MPLDFEKLKILFTKQVTVSEIKAVAQGAKAQSKNFQAFLELPHVNEVVVTITINFVPSQLIDTQNEDPSIIKVKGWLREGKRPIRKQRKDEGREWRHLYFDENGILVQFVTPKYTLSIIIPHPSIFSHRSYYLINFNYYPYPNVAFSA